MTAKPLPWMTIDELESYGLPLPADRFEEFREEVYQGFMFDLCARPVGDIPPWMEEVFVEERNQLIDNFVAGNLAAMGLDEEAY